MALFFGRLARTSWHEGADRHNRGERIECRQHYFCGRQCSGLADLRYPACRGISLETSSFTNFIGLAGQSVTYLVPEYPNLLVTRTLSKARSLAGFGVGYAVLPQDLADDLNKNNDAYPLARPSQAAAIATLQHEDKIRARVAQLFAWTEGLARELRALGVRTFPTQAYFHLAAFAPHDAATLADKLREFNIQAAQ